jgi:hypothetical protein
METCPKIMVAIKNQSRRSQRPRGLWRESAAASLLEMRVRIPPEGWMSVSCKRCLLSDMSLRRAYRSSRGILPNVMCLSAIENPQRGGAGSLGLSRHKKIINQSTPCHIPEQRNHQQDTSNKHVLNLFFKLQH